MSENLFLGDTTYPHLPDTEDQPVLIIDVAGNPVLNVCGDVKAPANYSFECVNNFVHCEDPQYEELQYLALGMSNRIEQLERALTEEKKRADSNERMFGAACNDLGLLSEAFDIDSNIDGGAEPILEAIDDLKDLLLEAKKDSDRLDFVLKNTAFTTRTIEAGKPFENWQLMTQDEDEDYVVLSGEGKYFASEREAIDAAIKEQQ